MLPLFKWNSWMQRESIEKLLHTPLNAILQLHSQLDSCNLSSETDMAGAAAAAAAGALPPGYLTCFRLPAACSCLPSTVHCLRSTVSYPVGRLLLCDTVRLPFACVAISFGFLCSVTGTRWYSEYASKFVSFSPTGGTRRYEIGWPASPSRLSCCCRRRQLCRNLCAWIVGQLLLGHNSQAVVVLLCCGRVFPLPPPLAAYGTGFVCNLCAVEQTQNWVTAQFIVPMATRIASHRLTFLK